jgi:transposase
MRTTPEIVEVNSTQLEDVLRRAEQSLDPEDYRLLRAITESYAYIADLVEDKNTSIRRLRKLFFGARTEKTDTVVGRRTEQPDDGSHEHPAGAQPTSEGADLGESDEADEASALQGHGRHAADVYRGAERIEVPHESFRAGDPCPECRQGTLYEKPPGVLVRITVSFRQA